MKKILCLIAIILIMAPFITFAEMTEKVTFEELTKDLIELQKGIEQYTAKKETRNNPANTCPDFAALFQKVGPAVNRVEVGYYYNVSTPDETGYIKMTRDWSSSIGTGIFIEYGGETYVLTNNHVVNDEDYEKNNGAHPQTVNFQILVYRKEIKVLWRGEEHGPDLDFNVEIIGKDVELDIAVLRVINPPNVKFPTVKLGDSDKIMTGEPAFAIGSPSGLDDTITTGIISAKKRNGNDFGASTYYIQHTAPINQGNSGGPLFNANGEIIGVNTLILQSENGKVEGAGFAIPINVIKENFDALIKDGKIKKYKLGLNVIPIPLNLSQIKFDGLREKLERYYGVKIPKNLKEGFCLNGEQEGQAAKAGLKSGDIVLRINGKSFHAFLDLKEFVQKNKLAPVIIEVLRDGKTFSVQLQPEEK